MSVESIRHPSAYGERSGPVKQTLDNVFAGHLLFALNQKGERGQGARSRALRQSVKTTKYFLDRMISGDAFSKYIYSK